MIDLAQLFFQLGEAPSPESDVESFKCIAIPERTNWRVGKGVTGQPAVLIHTGGIGDSISGLAVDLENLRVQHGVLCRLADTETGVSESRYSIIQCLSSDLELQTCFLRSVGGSLFGLEEGVEASDLTELIAHLVSLFRLVRAPRSKTVAGLWGELFIIADSENPALLIDAWHSENHERFDFSMEAQRIEAKASGLRTRSHHFRFEQLIPPEGVDVLVASLFVEESSGGVSLGELWDRVVDLAATPESRLKVERLCVEALGAELSSARSRSFDWELAKESLRFFRHSDVPCVTPPIPLGVSEVRFCSDLSLSEPIGGDARLSGVLHGSLKLRSV